MGLKIQEMHLHWSFHRKAYRLYAPKRKQVHESGDAIFFENELGDQLQKKGTNDYNAKTSAIFSQLNIYINNSEQEADEEAQNQWTIKMLKICQYHDITGNL